MKYLSTQVGRGRFIIRPPSRIDENIPFFQKAGSDYLFPNKKNNGIVA
jgi:hypothetical protein